MLAQSGRKVNRLLLPADGRGACIAWSSGTFGLVRFQVQVRLSEDARRGWDRLCTDNGCTLTAVLEALGRELDAGRSPVPERVLKAAREIDRERRSRR